MVDDRSWLILKQVTEKTGLGLYVNENKSLYQEKNTLLVFRALFFQRPLIAFFEFNQ